MRWWLFAVSFFFLLSCAQLQEPTKSDQSQEKPPNQIIWEGRIEIVQNGKLQTLIQAGQIKTYDRNKTTLLDSGVVMDFFDKKGDHKSHLTSLKARVEEAKDFFLAEGNVIVVSDSGHTLRTERLFWDKKKQRIRSDTLVTITTDLDSLSGYQFESNEDLTSWQLQQPKGLTFRQFGP